MAIIAKKTTKASPGPVRSMLSLFKERLQQIQKVWNEDVRPLLAKAWADALTSLFGEFLTTITKCKGMAAARVFLENLCDRQREPANGLPHIR